MFLRCGGGKEAVLSGCLNAASDTSNETGHVSSPRSLDRRTDAIDCYSCRIAGSSRREDPREGSSKAPLRKARYMV